MNDESLAAEMLDKAIQIIDTKGWTRQVYEDPVSGALCVMGAVYKADSDCQYAAAISSAINKALLAAMTHQNEPAWVHRTTTPHNDNCIHSKEEAIEWMKSARELLLSQSTS